MNKSKFKIGDTVFLSRENGYGRIIIQFQVTQISCKLIFVHGELKISDYCYRETCSRWVAESDLFGSFEEVVKYFGAGFTRQGIVNDMREY